MARYCAARLLTAVFALLSFSTCCGQDSDVVTCGGFVEAATGLVNAIGKDGDSAARVDYSRVHMHLYTSQGLLKYSTECAPNGMYVWMDRLNAYTEQATISFLCMTKGRFTWRWRVLRAGLSSRRQYHSQSRTQIRFSVYLVCLIFSYLVCGAARDARMTSILDFWGSA